MKPAEKHYRELERLLFAPEFGREPQWLIKSVKNCQQRYSGIALTDQFKAAINAFDSENTSKPFELFVVGEGKFGKSTLVNCLLGEEQSKVRGLPETRCFLRYVVTDQPKGTARFYLRTQKGIHDWLLARVGKGRPVKELFEILEHEVDANVARELLETELSRLDQGNYEPAIYEIEKDIKQSSRTIFSNSIRVVDTQGLDQLFPDELKHTTKGLSDETTSERFIQWMNNSPRGKHLEWQFRRCDAVLWCVNAKRLGSAATAASLKYFSSYSKKIIIALTNIDIAKNDNDRMRLLERAEKFYGAESSQIVPINGQAAWDGLINNTEHKLLSSGFEALVRVLTHTCETEGLKVRNIARYSGLRQTELQYRMALRVLSDDYAELMTKYKLDVSRVKGALETELSDLRRKINQTGNNAVAAIHAKVSLITTGDDPSDVERKLGIYVESAKLESFIRHMFENEVIRNVASQSSKTSPYQLPAFDADGNRAGNKASVRPELVSLSLKLGVPAFQFRLNGWDKWKDIGDAVWGGIAGIFSESERQAARNRIEQRRKDRQNHVKHEFNSGWQNHMCASIKNAEDEATRQYKALFDAIDRVYERIERHAGGSVTSAKTCIDKSLKEISVQPVFNSHLHKALMCVRSSRR